MKQKSIRESAYKNKWIYNSTDDQAMLKALMNLNQNWFRNVFENFSGYPEQRANKRNGIADELAQKGP